MPVDLSVSQHVIESFLAGAKLKEAKQQRIAEAEARREALEVRKQQIAELAQQFKEKHQLEQEKALSDQEYNKARIKQIAANIKLQGINALSGAKFITTPDGRRINIGDLVEGYQGPMIEAMTPTEQSTQEINKQVGIAQGKEDVTMPGKREMAILQGNIQANNQGAVQAAIDARAEKDRKARIDAANIRANATYARADATKQERQQVDDETAELHMPDIMTGQTSLEQLKKMLPAQTLVRVTNTAKKNGWRVFTQEEQAKFNASPILKKFMQNVDEYNNALNEGRLLDARNLYNTLTVDLRTFARNEKGEKGNMSNQDIKDMANALPHWTTLDKAENARRVDKIKETYFSRMDQTFRGMSPVQRRAVEKRWQILTRPVKNPKTGDTYSEIEE